MSVDKYTNLSQRIKNFFESDIEDQAIVMSDMNCRISAKPNDQLEIAEFIICLELQANLDDMTKKNWNDYNTVRELAEHTFRKENVYQVDSSYFQHGKARLYIFIDDESGII